MIERMGSTYQSLQGIEAGRHIQATQTESKVVKKVLWDDLSKPETTVPEQELDTEIFQPLSNAVPQAAPKKDPLGHLAPMIQEIREIAEASGYVDVNSEDIIRAYRNGGSFLADHRV